MNWRRGLFRTWIVLSGLWIIATAVACYVVIASSGVGGDYQWVAKLRLDFDKIDWSRPLYEIVVPPAELGGDLAFAPVETQHLYDWDARVRSGQMVKVAMPDQSMLYLSAQLTKADQDLLTSQFWERRWERWLSWIWTWVAVALGVPLVVLALGAACVWAARACLQRVVF